MEKKKIMLFEEWQQNQPAEEPKENEENETTRFQPLIDLINGTWAGDVTGDEATAGFTQEELTSMVGTITAHPEVFKIDGEPGVPFPEDNSQYAELLKTDAGAQLIQKMVDKFEDSFDERED